MSDALWGQLLPQQILDCSKENSVVDVSSEQFLVHFFQGFYFAVFVPMKKQPIALCGGVLP